MSHAMFRAVKEWKHGDVLVIIQNQNTEEVTAMNLGMQLSLQNVPISHVQVRIKLTYKYACKHNYNLRVSDSLSVLSIPS